MGSNNSNMRHKSRSLPAVERVRCTESAPSTPSVRSRLINLAQSSSKKLSKISFKRKGGNREQTKAFAELISRWPHSHLDGLFRELEASRVLYVLNEKAERARPPIPSIGEQLLASDTHDLRLAYKGEECAVHCCIIRARCDNLPESCGGRISLDEHLSHLDLLPSQLKQIVHWLYTEEWLLEHRLLPPLKESLGCWRSLPEDLSRVENAAAERGDLCIALVSQPPGDGTPLAGCSEVQVRVHSCLVAARSAVLGRLLSRGGQPTRESLFLDESLLPRAFLPLIVHFMYTDRLDLTLISSERACTSSLSEVRAIVAGRSPNASLQRAAHLVHIARFLGLHSLAQQCGEVVLSHVSLSTCVPLLSWCLESGSPWMTRQLRSFCISDFSRILHSPALFDLPQQTLQDLLSSHFLQASEVEVLEGVVRWGEQELLRRLEQREPNLVADTVHSVSRRGLSRAELGGGELRYLLAPIAGLVRADYVLPPFHQSVTSAYQRGILQRGSLRDLVVCASTAEIDPDRHWFAPPDCAPGPRLFLPHYQAVAERVGERRQEGAGREGAGPEGASDSSPPPPPVPLLPHLVIINQMPDLLSDAQFETVKNAVGAAVEEECERHGLALSLTRNFHRKMAVQLIASRVMREMDVLEESVSVSFGEVPPPREATPSSIYDKPSPFWPDLLPPSTAHSSPLL